MKQIKKTEDKKEITLPVYNADGKEVDSITLDSKVFDGKVNTDVIYQAVNAYRASHRTGLAATKTRGEVSGGGRKPWKQKGTGRARVGSTRSPLWRHGGVVFGPHPRDYSYTLPQKIRALALKSSLNAKVNENNMVILDSLIVAQPKTKEVCRIFANLKLAPTSKSKGLSVLFLNSNLDQNLKLALRNISFVDAKPAQDVHCYDVLAHKKIVVTKDGLKILSERFHGSVSGKTAAAKSAPVAAKKTKS